MRCSRNVRAGNAFRFALLGLALPWLWGPSAVEAQSSRRRAADDEAATADNMKMPSTSIEGERQTPDIFFVFPTGRGGNLSMPHVRDYGPDILEPVVKPWFEREQALGPSQIQTVTRQSTVDWKEALRSAPPPPPREQPLPESPARPSLPAPSIPSSALSRPAAAAPPGSVPVPPPPDSPIYQRPPPAYGVAPTPPPAYAAPPPAQPPTYRGVPVLPPQ
ncbi:MAG: hypothetical protein ACREQQ_05985 [Candidatus Binatia bacterium]